MEEKPALTKEERRARKLARREKQREQNAGRALKMRQARLAVVRKPPSEIEPPPKYNVGCSGWFYWHWRGLFYPQGLPTKDWFRHYRRTLGTVELNAPFYSWPTVNGVQTWIKQVQGSEFVYTVKVCELITHVKRFSRTKTLVKDFGFIADLLGGRMGCFLFQLPPSYDYTPARLKAIVSQLDPCRRNVVEFRHSSWWRAGVYEAFRDAGIIFCSCSAPKLPNELVKTADEIYLRFHGTTRWYRHDYSQKELVEWAGRIRDSGAARVWAYFNNDYSAHATSNAAELHTLLNASQ